MIHLNSFKGWKLVSETTIIMYVFSLMFYILKYKNHDYYGLNDICFKDCFYVLSGLTNIIFVLIFTNYN